MLFFKFQCPILLCKTIIRDCIITWVAITCQISQRALTNIHMQNKLKIDNPILDLVLMMISVKYFDAIVREIITTLSSVTKKNRLGKFPLS